MAIIHIKLKLPPDDCMLMDS